MLTSTTLTILYWGITILIYKVFKLPSSWVSANLNKLTLKMRTSFQMADFYRKFKEFYYVKQISTWVGKQSNRVANVLQSHGKFNKICSYFVADKFPKSLYRSENSNIYSNLPVTGRSQLSNLRKWTSKKICLHISRWSQLSHSRCWAQRLPLLFMLWRENHQMYDHDIWHYQ